MVKKSSVTFAVLVDESDALHHMTLAASPWSRPVDAAEEFKAYLSDTSGAAGAAADAGAAAADDSVHSKSGDCAKEFGLRFCAMVCWYVGLLVCWYVGLLVFGMLHGKFNNDTERPNLHMHVTGVCFDPGRQ